MIDIDTLAWDGDINDQRTMLAHAIQQLPIEFQSVDCWYHFSSSMGIKDDIRVHLWYWLEKPCSDDEMKAWLSGCPVDSYPNRSGLFEVGGGVSTVPAPADLASKTAVVQTESQ
jgi:hypothetical protein